MLVEYLKDCSLELEGDLSKLPFGAASCFVEQLPYCPAQARPNEWRAAVQHSVVKEAHSIKSFSSSISHKCRAAVVYSTILAVPCILPAKGGRLLLRYKGGEFCKQATTIQAYKGAKREKI